MSEESFEGWAILELMGHRKLAGRVSEAVIGGGSFLRLDIFSGCTGISAGWCPICGDCKCDRDSDEDRSQFDENCPLHREESLHGEEIKATQFYSPASVYCLTPTTEETARGFTATRTPRPVERWELPAPKEDGIGGVPVAVVDQSGLPIEEEDY